MTPEYVRDRLLWITELTKGARAVPGYFIGEEYAAAQERRVWDDNASGRLDWNRANAHAWQGLMARDDERAAEELYQAERCLIDAMVARLKPGDFDDLSASAEMRGRRAGSSPNADIDRALADAFDAVDPAVRGDLRMAEAKRALPADVKNELAHLGRPALRKRIRKGRTYRKA